MSAVLDIREIKAMMQARIEEYCREMLPKGRREAGQWASSNPITQDYKKTAALKVTLSGSSAGAWICWRSGAKGDAIGLAAYLNGGDPKDHKFGRQCAASWLGVSSMKPEERREARDRAEKTRAAQEKDAAKQRERKLKAAKELYASAPESWNEWVKAGSGVLMPVQKHFIAYLAARGIAIDQIKHLDPLTFRFSPATEYWRLAEWRKNAKGYMEKTKAGPEYPTVHSAIRGKFGQGVACHCTFLDPLLPQKAPVSPPKLMRGEALGGLISISRGPTDKNHWEPQKSGLVAIAEGIETALTIAEAIPEARVWAAGSLANFRHCPVDLECVGEIVLCRDNNEGNAQAQKLFDSCLQELETHGKPVTVINPPDNGTGEVDDFNDLAMMET